MPDGETAIGKCPAKRLEMIGKPTERDLAATADQQAPTVAEADFKTTVDKTDWHG